MMLKHTFWHGIPWSEQGGTRDLTGIPAPDLDSLVALAAHHASLLAASARLGTTAPLGGVPGELEARLRVARLRARWLALGVAHGVGNTAEIGGCAACVRWQQWLDRRVADGDGPSRR